MVERNSVESFGERWAAAKLVTGKDLAKGDEFYLPPLGSKIGARLIYRASYQYSGQASMLVNGWVTFASTRRRFIKPDDPVCKLPPRPAPPPPAWTVIGMWDDGRPIVAACLFGTYESGAPRDIRTDYYGSHYPISVGMRGWTRVVNAETPTQAMHLTYMAKINEPKAETNG